MVSFSFKVIAALAAAAAVQANMDHELEVRDWEARRLAPRNFELITTKVTMLVPKGSYKTVTKYKTVTVTDCGGGGGTTTDPVPTPTGTTTTDTFPLPTSTDTTIPTATDTLTGVPTPTDTNTLTGVTPTNTLTAAPTATGTLTGIPTATDTLTGVPGANTTTDPFATPTTTGTNPVLGGNTTTDPFATATATLGGGANATSTAADPFGTINANATVDPFATTTAANPFATTTAANPLGTSVTTPVVGASLDIFGDSTDTVVFFIDQEDEDGQILQIVHRQEFDPVNQRETGTLVKRLGRRVGIQQQPELPKHVIAAARAYEYIKKNYQKGDKVVLLADSDVSPDAVINATELLAKCLFGNRAPPDKLEDLPHFEPGDAGKSRIPVRCVVLGVSGFSYRDQHVTALNEVLLA
ncbi:hypothetical protein FRC11_009691, partial [Ceratobasidium sp. 423]